MNLARSLWTNFSEVGLDWLFPKKCSLCGLLGEESPCAVCASQMRLAAPNFIDDLDVNLSYRACVFAYEGRAAQAVRRLKYSRATSLGAFMSEAVASRVRELTVKEEILVPVPIHRGRRAIRGFNQAEICASGDHGLAVHADWLRRIRPTRPQAGLSLTEREKNLKGAFVASQEVRDQLLVLIDDVVTSGYTARMCAKALKEAGAKSVGIIAFCGNLD